MGFFDGAWSDQGGGILPGWLATRDEAAADNMPPWLANTLANLQAGGMQPGNAPQQPGMSFGDRFGPAATAMQPGGAFDQPGMGLMPNPGLQSVSPQAMQAWRQSVAAGADNGGIAPTSTPLDANGRPIGEQTAIPPAAQPTAGALPQRAPQGGAMPSALNGMPVPQMPSLAGLFGGQAAPDASSPGFGDRLGAGLQGFLHGGAPLPALGNLIGGLITGKRQDPEGYARLQSEDAQKSALQYIAQEPDLNPAMKKALIANPAMALKYVEAKMKPHDSSSDITEYEYAKKQGYAGSLADWMARKRAGAGEYGLQPIWGTGPDGEPTIVQLGKSGDAVQSKIPPGIKVGKEAIKIDTGTSIVLLDPVTRQFIKEVPKNIEAREIAEKVGASQGEGRVALPTVVSNAERMLRQIDEVQKHPGRESATGAILGRVPGLAGSQLDFVERMDQLKGQTFLQAFQTLKGAGAITEVEGAKATAAIGRLSRAKSAADIDAALNDLREVINTGVRNAKIKAGQDAQAPASAGPAPGRYVYDPATGQMVQQ